VHLLFSFKGGIMIGRTILTVFLILLAVSLVPHSSVLANGGKAKTYVYIGEVASKSGSARWTFKLEMNPAIFYLGTVNNKYHVIMISVISYADSPLKLSINEDTAVLVFGDDKKVTAVLNLPGVDRATWDGLERSLRDAIAYPQVVPPQEQEGIYLFIPVSDIQAESKNQYVPSEISYSLKSVGEISLRLPKSLR
jgi:hypothetical protein